MTAPHVDKVAMRVVTFLGVASVLGIVAASLLCFVALGFEGNESAGIVIAIVGNLASAALASLGSILASTGKGGTPAPTPVTVDNPPSDPVPTAPQPSPAGDPAYSVGPIQPDELPTPTKET